MSKTDEAITGTSFAFSIRSMPSASMLDVSKPEADCSFAVEERICRSGQAPIPAIVVDRMQRGSNDMFAFGDVNYWEDLNDPSLERYFGGRNAPYPLNDPSNPLKLQEMRPPSERTKRVTH